jgi:hypothetical protein
MRTVPKFSNIVRKMGYLTDSQGLIDLFIDTEGAWSSHLNNTRQFIAGRLKGRRIKDLAVYGSGWLLDFPLEEALQAADHITLFDAVHPTQILHKIKKFKQVTAVSADITGGAMISAYHAVQQYRKTHIKPDPRQFCQGVFTGGIRHDYAISLNILSQVGELTKYLARFIDYTEDEVEEMQKCLQESHLKILQPGCACLITDIESLGYDASGQLLSTSQLIKCSMPVTGHAQTWEWQYDPNGDVYPGLKTLLKVMALEL